MDQELKEYLMGIILKENKKEYVCHLQYVVEIGMRLANAYPSVDPLVIEVACLLHDIGRDKELPGEVHAQTGHRLGGEILKNTQLSEDQKKNILSCILLHNSDDIPETIEQQIVRTADAGSKVEYHEAFMLMCKKPTYNERLAWGIKYLEKGYKKICIDSYQVQIQKKYEMIHSIYEKTLTMIDYVN